MMSLKIGGICYTVEKKGENKIIIQFTANRLKNTTLGPSIL